jgi:exodeoxyribonuclease V gamma subunit
MLQIHHSNRLEVLLDHLLEVLATPLADPLAPERIVVQHPGMGRWLAQELALRTGIAANLEFPLPARFFWELLGHWFEQVPDRSEGWDRKRLAWRLFACLPDQVSGPDFSGPARYLASEPRELKTYQLARRVADLFDQYLVYRPDLVLAWEAGERPEFGPDARWQARLWRELAAGIGSPHRATLFARLEQALAEGTQPYASLPERILIFGLSALAPVYGRILARVAERLPAHLFVLSPSQEYWADLVDEARRARIRALDLNRGAPDRAALLDVGNPLLASWGRGGMALQDLLLDLGGDGAADGLSDYREPDTDSLLGLIQSDLLHLHDRRRPHPADRTPLDPADGSIQVHACHGPHRELQVLHDRLLRLFEELPGLRPRDVIVMAPDIDRYAPHIEAVFGEHSSPTPIPCAIADRRLSADQPLLTAVAALLGLPDSRLGAAEVMGWLEVPAIARRFGLDARALARVRTWVAETGVRWGLDSAMRRDLELPGEDANTWAFGLRRLFLGYALPPLPPSEGALYGEVLPYPDLEGPEAEALGGLQAYIDTLARWRRELPRPRPAADWAVDLGRLLSDLLDPDEEEETLLQPLREALEGLSADAQAAGFDEPLGLDILRTEVAECLDGTAAAQRFLTGRVTFCNMVPMRSIPARVLCLLGLNGTDFPRDQRPPAFDLMAAKPRRGDRSRRDDDRHLFLESLLSARERLHLSYVGNDERDNAVRVPSVLLEELLAYIQGSFWFADGTELMARLVVRHPLQPFSRRYFDGSDTRLYSYREDWCRAARAQPEEGSDRFVAAPLPSAGPSGDTGGLETLDLDDLIRFLRSPAQWFLTRTLGLRGPDEADTLEETEPFAQDRLQAWQMKQRLLELAGTGREGEWGPVLRGAGILPHGPAGDLTLEQAGMAVGRFRARLAPYLADPLEPLELDLPIAGLRLTGWLSGLTGTGLVAYRLGRARAEDQLALWVRHLALNLAGPVGVPPRSVLVTEEETIALAPVADAEGRLAELVAFFRQGQTEPLPLFPKTSLAYAAGGWDGRAWTAWEGGFERGPGESAHPAIRTAFRGRDPLAPPFEALATQVFGPLLAAIIEEEAS